MVQRTDVKIKTRDIWLVAVWGIETFQMYVIRSRKVLNRQMQVAL